MDKAQVANYFEVEVGAVVGWRLVDEGENVRALIDYGIGGIKVYIIPAARFIPEPEPLPVPIVLDLNDEPADPELESLTVSELRDLAKEAGVSYAGLKKAELIEALESLDEVE